MFEIYVRDFNRSLKTPFKSAKGIVDKIHVLEFKIQSPTKESFGYGVFPQNADYEYRNFIEKLLEIQILIRNNSQQSQERTLREILALLENIPWAASALEIAIEEYLGLHQETKKKRFFEPLRPSGFSLPTATSKELLELVLKFKHYPILKLKVDASFSEKDLKNIRAIYDGRLWIDANGSWSQAQFLKNLDFMNYFQVEIIEDPLKDNSPDAYREIPERTLTKIALDQSIRGLQDLGKYQGLVDIINLKFHKNGGPSVIAELAQKAKSLGYKIMLGTKNESIQSVAKIAELAPLADYWDFDGHLDIIEQQHPHFRWQEGSFYFSPHTGPQLAKPSSEGTANYENIHKDNKPSSR